MSKPTTSGQPSPQQRTIEEVYDEYAGVTGWVLGPSRPGYSVVLYGEYSDADVAAALSVPNTELKRTGVTMRVADVS